MGAVEIHRCTLKEPDAIAVLSQTLARYFPESEHCATGIYELLLNAVEHGNLGIGFEVKTELVRRGTWEEEIRRRLSLPEYAGRQVAVRVTQEGDECRLTIADEGSGFPWKTYLNRKPDLKRPNGRGLHIAFNSEFDRVTFNSTGNEVTCVARSRH